MTAQRALRRRVFFINRFFYPDQSATAQLLTDLCSELAEEYDIHVVTSQASRSGQQALMPETENVLGCTAHRLPAAHGGHDNLRARAMSYARFYMQARRFLHVNLQAGDVVVVKTDPPALSAFLAPVIRKRGALLVNWLQDLYPEVATVLGVKLGPLAPILRVLRDRALRLARMNVALGALMADKIAGCGVASEHIRIIPNWCDDHTIQPVAAKENPLRDKWGLGDAFVVGYSGNLGRAHEFDTILAAALRLKHRKDIRFLFVGGGHFSAVLQQQVVKAGLQDMFVFQPHQPRELLPQTLPVADACLVSLQPALEGLIVPSKFYGILAAGRPVLNVASPEGELAEIISVARCGYSVSPGDDASLASIIANLVENPSAVADLGRNGRAFLDGHYTRAMAFDRWRELLAGLPPA